jgi:hypothetical protein
MVEPFDTFELIFTPEILVEVAEPLLALPACAGREAIHNAEHAATNIKLILLFICKSFEKKLKTGH